MEAARGIGVEMRVRGLRVRVDVGGAASTRVGGWGSPVGGFPPSGVSPRGVWGLPPSGSFVARSC